MSGITMHERSNSLSANVEIDDENEVLTIYSVRISAELLRSFQAPTPAGNWFRIVNVEDGKATIETKRLAFPHGSARYTYTYAALEVTPAVYDEIATKLRDADYHHAFDKDTGAIDMHGIGLVRES